jgi:hypothetical protein
VAVFDPNVFDPNVFDTGVGATIVDLQTQTIPIVAGPLAVSRKLDLAALGVAVSAPALTPALVFSADLVTLTVAVQTEPLDVELALPPASPFYVAKGPRRLVLPPTIVPLAALEIAVRVQPLAGTTILALETLGIRVDPIPVWVALRWPRAILQAEDDDMVLEEDPLGLGV